MMALTLRDLGSNAPPMDDLQRLTLLERQFRRRPQSYRGGPSSGELKFIAFLVSTAGAGRGDRVLDVACGTGAMTLAFADRCGSAVGIDIAEPALAHARNEASQRGLANAEFVLGELERMPFADGAFAGAVCRFSFHHFVNPARVFAEMTRVVGPNGWMVIADMTASEEASKAELHNELERLADPTHSRTMAPSEFESMFAANDFRTVMKIARDARTTLDEWIGFNDTPPADAARIRELMEGSLEGDRAGLRAIRDGSTIRTIRTSTVFVIERE
jgi:ubiquinone/menaquinone biosynthesis C-methylase UbiE